LQRQQEYEDFQKDVRKRQEVFEQQKLEQQKQYQGLREQREINEQLKNEGLMLIDQGKKWRARHDFEKAYKLFKQAIEKFNIIGWNEEIQYIQTEIKNTKIVEEKEKIEDLKIQEIEKDLKKQRDLKKRKRKEEKKKKKQTVGEISNITHDISKMIEERKLQEKTAEERERERIKLDAKEFGKNEEAQKMKDQEEIDDLAKMIKEAAKKARNNYKT